MSSHQHLDWRKTRVEEDEEGEEEGAEKGQAETKKNNEMNKKQNPRRLAPTAVTARVTVGQEGCDAGDGGRGEEGTESRGGAHPLALER